MPKPHDFERRCQNIADDQERSEYMISTFDINDEVEIFFSASEYDADGTWINGTITHISPDGEAKIRTRFGSFSRYLANIKYA